MKFKKYRIEEIGNVFGGGTPSTKNKDYYGGEIPWLTPKDLSGYQDKYISSGARNISKLGLEKSSAILLPKNTVLLSSRAPIGYLAISSNPISTSQGFKSIVCDEKIIIPEYLYYLLKTKINELESVASGSTFKEISGKTLKQFEIEIPNVDTQKLIIQKLSIIDSKIKLNNQMIDTLEEIASTLFKRWFVDFEFPDENGNPYKSSGGKMIDSELGEIPEGWEIYSLSEVCSVKDGTHESPKQVEVGYPLVTSKHLKKNKIDISEAKLISKQDYDKCNVRSKVHQHDILISMIGTVGRIYYVTDDEITFAIKNIGLIKTSEVRYLSDFIYLQFISERVTNFINLNTTGSTQQYISLTNLRKIPIIIPSENILYKFNDIVSSTFNQSDSLKIEIDALEDTRDTLLPKLLSGELEV